MGTKTRWSVLVLLIVASSACELFGPSKPATGNWRAQSGHSTIWTMSITQTEDNVSGLVCVGYSTMLVVKAMPVSGRLPSVTFGDPETGVRFDGQYEEGRDQIAGDFSGVNPLRFNRSNEVCAQPPAQTRVNDLFLLTAMRAYRARALGSDPLGSVRPSE